MSALNPQVWSRAAQTLPPFNSTVKASIGANMGNSIGADDAGEREGEGSLEGEGESEWNTCLGGGGCEALCLFAGRARCVCPHGELAENGKNCTRMFAYSFLQ